MGIVRIAKLTKTYSGNARSDKAQTQSRNTVKSTLHLPHNIFA